MSWSVAKLCDVAPAKPLKPALVDYDVDVWQVTLDHIEPDTGRVLQRNIRPVSEAGASTHWFDENYVLYSKLRPYLNKVLLPDRIGLGTTELVPMLPDKELLDRSYLALYLRSPKFVNWVSSQTAGAKMPRVSMKVFWEHEIPLPPLEEQKRIVTILDKADTLRRKRQQAIQLADEFLRAVFLDMFGDPATNPKNWTTLPIGDLTSDWRGGSSMKPGDFAETGFPVLHKGAIHRNGKVLIDGKKKTHVSEEYARKNSRSIVDRDYMAVTLRDLVPTGPSIGLIADLSKYDTPQYMLSQGAYGFRIERERLVPSFLVALSNSPGFRVALSKIWVGSTQIHIRNGDFKDLAIPVPDFELLEKYQKIVDATQARLEHFGEFSALSNDFFSSVSSAAFSGTL